ncbi:tubby-like F-box protein 5 isoform X2 [Punica granatum]|uniref:Tubby-like F-box protein 5 isoform X2 n=1 Tax=Punica granatum TaxID=22663 RepID=A0A6P8E3Q0_PUNGR|nr:tubby-like F-box protein 5 isoform X2 [Punica granatum]
MSLKSIVRELKEMRDGIGNVSRGGSEGRRWRSRTRSHIAPEQAPQLPELPIEQGRWANLPPELLLDMIKRVEESETSWPSRAVVVFCASVCKSWRNITKEIVKTPEQCGRLTFPISLKQPGPRDCAIHCFIRRDPATSTYFLYYGLVPSEHEREKLLLAARKIRRATCTDFLISLASDVFSRASNTYVGKLRSNFIGTKFTIYDSQPPCEGDVQFSSRFSKKVHSKQVSAKAPVCNYSAGTVSYELNVLRTRAPRRMNCIMHSIPMSSIQEGGTAPTPTLIPISFEDQVPSHSSASKAKDTIVSDFSSTSLSEIQPSQVSEAPLVLKNKAPRWHEQLQCWCLNFRGRVTVASVKNFQLVAALEPSHNTSSAEQEKDPFTPLGTEP